MPWGDGTGLAGGGGPGTGRGRGRGRGLGRGMGSGIGQGQGTGRSKIFAGGVPSVNQFQQAQQPITEEQEIEMLKQQAQTIQQQMNMILKRIDELSGKGENMPEKNTSQIAVVDNDLCTGCGLCEDVCDEKAITVGEVVAEINEERCNGCGNCVKECPNEAITLR